MKNLTAILLCLVIHSSLVADENWPRFRGPEGKGKPTAESEVPLEWNEKKNVKWKLELPGPGSSSPIVWADRVFITAYSGYGTGDGGSVKNLQRHLLAINRLDGDVIWQVDIPSLILVLKILFRAFYRNTVMQATPR